jgi:hypothetical protein
MVETGEIKKTAFAAVEKHIYWMWATTLIGALFSELDWS